jgi:hypothetical protein
MSSPKDFTFVPLVYPAAYCHLSGVSNAGCIYLQPNDLLSALKQALHNCARVHHFEEQPHI